MLGDEISLRYVGDRAVLLETDGAAAAHQVRSRLERARPDGVVESVVGAAGLLVLLDPARCDLAALRRAAATPSTTDGARPVTVHIPVDYDGADLAEVAELSGLTIEQVVARHAVPTYTVAFLGFAPGFGYLSGLDPALRVARRDSPRQRVPAGSVAIAGEYAAVYPRDTPGGWRLLGRTDVAMFDPDQDPPALLAPGTPVRFVPC
ncbi:MAG TPA: allophanate hydrolase subunit 1 [Mycobacteriales bacterium]|nr:allophanate hydrolase subunit 1 [Mycobacteriales bacterium]